MFKQMRFLRPYRISVWLVLILLFLQSLSTLYLPNLMSGIVDTGVLHGDVGYIWRVGGYMLLVAVLGAVCSVLAGLFASRAAAGFGKLLRRQIFEHVEHFTLHEFDRLGTSSLIVRTTNDVMQVQQFVNMMLRMMVMAPLTAAGGIIMAVYTNARLSLVVVVVMPLLGLAVYAVLGRGIRLFQVMQSKVDHLNRVLRENMAGVRVIRAFNRIGFEQGRLDRASLDLTDTSVRVYQMMAMLMPLMMLIINFSTLAIIWFGGVMISQGAMQIGNLMAFIQYVMQIMFAVMMVSMMSFMIPRAEASANRINEVLEMPLEIVDPDRPREMEAATPAGSEVAETAAVRKGMTRATTGTAGTAGVEMVAGLRGRVEFRHVSFRYPGAQEYALSDITFTARPGEITAIIGGTGAGKSTLLHLIPRFYDVDEGDILIDGVDVREQTQESLRAKIGFAPQKAVLFTGTIADNIRHGRPEATDEEVAHAVRVAQAEEFIAGMNGRMAATISQGGANLSGGQKQRLAIARALVRKPEILLFDDSFSALDYRTDARLRAALLPEVTDTTVIIVAQRVGAVMTADRIIVLEDGRIAGMGMHRELLDTCAVYREIASLQLSEEEIA